jgi:hypothetical protein
MSLGRFSSARLAMSLLALVLSAPAAHALPPGSLRMASLAAGLPIGVAVGRYAGQIAQWDVVNEPLDLTQPIQLQSASTPPIVQPSSTSTIRSTRAPPNQDPSGMAR